MMKQHFGVFLMLACLWSAAEAQPFNVSISPEQPTPYEAITVSLELLSLQSFGILETRREDRVLVIEVSFPEEMSQLANDAGHYCPSTLAKDLERLQHDPEIWLTGMKPGEEERILEQVLSAAPNKKIQMLSRGTVLKV